MTLKEDIQASVKQTFAAAWDRRNGLKVPDATDLTLQNQAVDLDATILYADMADSTLLVRDHTDMFAAEIFKTYLSSAARIIQDNGGVITAYDGDRIMAVFIDGAKNSNAVKSALHIRWVVEEVIQPALRDQYPSTSYVLRQKVGIDTSKVMVARTGVRGSNDLVWVGTAANNAAKLAARPATYSTYISEASYVYLLEWATHGGVRHELMWDDLGYGPEGFRVYGSSWMWAL